MGKRLIFCRVDDEYLRGAGQLAGAVGSHDDVYLRIQFGGMWAGMTKYVTFKDALGENPAKVWLLPSLLVEEELEVYDVPIPQSAKAVRGNMMVTVTGYGADETGKVEESLSNTVTAYFKILEADAAGGEDASVTLTLAQQVAAMLDKFNAAEKVRVEHETRRAEAEEARTTAEGARAEAEQGRESAEDSRMAAEAARATAEAARGEAEKARDEAEKRREDAGEGIVARARDMARWAQEEAEGAARHAEDAGAEANHAEDFARMAKADSQHAESEAAKAADLADDAEESYVKAFDEANRAAEEADRAKEEADRAANMGKSPYQVAVEAGYTGTEAEFYAALVALKDAPFLPLSGGLIQGPFAITPKDPDDGTAYDREPWLVICTNNRPEGFLPGYPAGDILWFNHSVVFNDPVEMDRLLVRGTITAENDIYGKAGRFSDTVYAGDGLRVKGKIDVFPSDEYPDKSVEISAEAKVYCRGVIPFSRIDSAADGKFPLGENGNRWNTLYTKKVDASEHIITPRIRPPEGTGTQYLRFITKGGVDPDASPDPLPVEWGGTGATSIQDLFAAANAAGILTKGEKGDPGPQGIQGPRGATGATGPQGPKGISNFAIGSWVGTGSTNHYTDIITPFAAKFIWLFAKSNSEDRRFWPVGNYSYRWPPVIVTEDLSYEPVIDEDDGPCRIYKSSDGKTISLSGGTPAAQANESGNIYFYIALG